MIGETFLAATEAVVDLATELTPDLLELPVPSPESLLNIQGGLSGAALGQTVELLDSVPPREGFEAVKTPDKTDETWEEDKKEKIPKEPKKQPDEKKPQGKSDYSSAVSGDFELTGEDMRQAALGFIYIVTGIPVDEM